jgi:inner membrane transporter RhtA
MRLSRIPPHAYFLVSAVFHYLGPAFAVLLFARVDALGVAWLRFASAALIFAAWRRPWRLVAGLQRDGRRLLLAWGALLAGMNACFYLAIDRLALATVAAIEFLPVVALAAFGVRTARNGAALALATAGVYLLTGARIAGEPLAVALAFANAGLFALYIVLGHRVSRLRGMGGIDGLAGSMIVAAVVATPLAGWAAVPALLDPVALAAGAGVGIASSVIPYVCDQLAMARLARATYALLVALLPATATVVGVVVLAQLPSAAELAGVGLVVAGVALHRGASARERGHRRVAPRDRADAAAAPRAGAADEDRRIVGLDAPATDVLGLFGERPAQVAMEDVAAGQAQLALEIQRCERLAAGRAVRPAHDELLDRLGEDGVQRAQRRL